MQGTVRLGMALACAVALLAGGAPVAAAAAPSAPDTPVARFDGITIDRATVDRWREFSFGGVDRDFELFPRCLRRASVSPECPRLLRSARRQALEFVVGLHQMLLTARRLGVAVPRNPRLPEHFEVPRGVPGLDRADRRLARRGLYAWIALGRHWVKALPPITDAQLERAWRALREPAWFTQRQVRAEVLQLRTRADADAALAALRGGESFAALGARLAPSRPARFRGELQLFSADVPDPFAEAHGKRPERPTRVARAVLAATPGALVGPLAIGGDFYVLRVADVVSEHALIPLAQVRERLLREVEFERAQRVTTRSRRRVNRAWRARTTCVRGFAARSVCGRVVARL